MKKGIIVFFLMMVLSLGVIGCAKTTVSEQPGSKLVPIRIGWQVAWATQGQIVQELKHSKFLEENGLKGDFKGFTYGAPLSEAALAGNIDVGFAADQPVISLIAKGGKYKIVSRLMDFRGAIIVPPESGIEKLSDLKGKTLAIPFGSTTHRIVLDMLIKAGLDPEKDLKIINMDIAEQAGVINAGDKKLWKGNVNAMASWDPNVAVFESKGLAKVLKQDVGLAVVYMSDDFIAKNPDKATAFMKAYVKSYYEFIKNQAQANTWFVEEARIQFDPSILNVVSSYEKNIAIKDIKDIDLLINQDNIKMMEDGVEFAYKNKMIKVKPVMKDYVNNNLLQQALEQIKKEGH
ncbi:MAG: ABC transporter substrate-binding protein [Ignavibacteriales bacterium]